MIVVVAVPSNELPFAEISKASVLMLINFNSMPSVGDAGKLRVCVPEPVELRMFRLLSLPVMVTVAVSTFGVDMTDLDINTLLLFS